MPLSPYVYIQLGLYPRWSSNVRYRMRLMSQASSQPGRYWDEYVGVDVTMHSAHNLIVISVRLRIAFASLSKDNVLVVDSFGHIVGWSVCWKLSTVIFAGKESLEMSTLCKI